MPQTIRPIRIEGNLAFVTLTQGYEAAIDAENSPLVAEWNWCALVQRRSDGTVRSVYAIRTDCSNRTQKAVWMHRIIMNTPHGMETDHIDGNGLNNCRVNLRVATKSENQRNRCVSSRSKSGVKGVAWVPGRGKWKAYIRVSGTQHYLGSYSTMDAASKAYAEASAKLHGPFGRTS